MKKLLPLIAVFAFAVFQTACKKALPDIDFTREYGNIEFTILPKDSVGEFSLIDKVITTDIKQELTDNGFTENNLKEVKIESAVISIIDDNQSLNFDFVRSATAQLISNTNFIFADVQLPESYTSRSIDLNPSSFDLKSYFKGESLNVVLKAVTELPVVSETKCRLALRFRIKAGI